MDDVRVLVTGGGGVVGAATVAALRARGATALSLGRSGECDLRCDIRDRKRLREALAATTPTTVVHAAYLLADRSAREPRAAIALNLLGFLNVLEESSAAGVTSFLYASSIAVYDNTRATHRAHIAPRFPYGTMKLLNEQQAAVRGGFERCCGVRIANVYHAGRGRGQSGWLPTAVYHALRAERARVELAADARIGIIWARDVGERLSAMALSPGAVRWPIVTDSGGEEVTGAGLSRALTRAGATTVDLGHERYEYPSTLPSPWLDDLLGRPVIPLVDALAAMAAPGPPRPAGVHRGPRRSARGRTATRNLDTGPPRRRN